MSDETTQPPQEPREPVQDLPAGQIQQESTSGGEVAQPSMELGDVVIPSTTVPPAVAGDVREGEGKASLQPPAGGAPPPQDLAVLSQAELERATEGMRVKAWALMFQQFNTLVQQAQQTMNVVTLAEIMKAMADVQAKLVDCEAKLEDMARAKRWDKRLGDIITEKANPSLLGQGPMGPGTAKVAGNLQKARKLAAGDQRTTPEKGKRVTGPRPLPPDDV